MILILGENVGYEGVQSKSMNNFQMGLDSYFYVITKQSFVGSVAMLHSRDYMR